MYYYVRIDGIPEQTLAFMGYMKIVENEEFILYQHKGDEIIVDRSDMMLKVDDINDALLLGDDIFKV